jgi:hypothetical protein
VTTTDPKLTNPPPPIQARYFPRWSDMQVSLRLLLLIVALACVSLGALASYLEFRRLDDETRPKWLPATAEASRGN